MFTGIVETAGRVTAIESKPFGKRLRVDRGQWMSRAGQIVAGDSIAVAGVCLTVSGQDGTEVAFDVIPETLAMTTLGQLRVGSRVNLESSLTAQTPMGGHSVQGHIEQVGTVTEVVDSDGERRLGVTVSPEVLTCVIPKGSVALDGVSLTVAAVEPQQLSFEVALIPTTLQITTLGELKVGDGVNVETDILSRTIVHTLQQLLQQREVESAGPSVTIAMLREAGFA